MHLLLTNSGHFSLSAAVSWFNYQQYLELFGFLEGAHNRGFPSNLTIYTSPLDEDWPLVWLVMVHFACPMISYITHYCTVF